jgi:hypothetical protein
VPRRQHRNLPVRVALSPTQAASATGLNYVRVIRPAVETGALPVHLIGAAHGLSAGSLARPFNRGSRASRYS